MLDLPYKPLYSNDIRPHAPDHLKYNIQTKELNLASPEFNLKNFFTHIKLDKLPKKIELGMGLIKKSLPDFPFYNNMII